MGRNKIMLYGLLLVPVLLLTVAVASVGDARARYINTDSWYTSLTVEPAGQVTGNCLTEGGQTVLLGQMELQELQVPFTMNSPQTVSGVFDWEVREGADYLQAGLLLGEEVITKQTAVELAAGESIFDLQLMPTEQALTSVHEEITVTVRVSWITQTQTLTADFRTALPALTEAAQTPSDPDTPSEPSETTDTTETTEQETVDASQEQQPAVITETEETTSSTEETTTPTEETTAPTEETTTPTEETTAPTEETTTPTEETTAPTEETTTPTEETTAPTEETTEPTEETTEPTEETTDPTQPDSEVEGASAVKLSSLTAFGREHYLPVIITVPQGADRVVLTGSISVEQTQADADQSGEASEEQAQTQTLSQLPPFTRYSPDGGSSWYLLYYGGAVELNIASDTQRLLLLLDLSATEEADALTLQAQAYAGQASVGTAEHTARLSDTLPVTAGSEPWILSDKERLVLQLDPAWSGCVLEYTVEMLTADKNLETVEYIPVELSEDTLYAVRDTQEDSDELTLRLGKELPQAGTYRITFTWKLEAFCFATEQKSFFINYSSD